MNMFTSHDEDQENKDNDEQEDQEGNSNNDENDKDTSEGDEKNKKDESQISLDSDYDLSDQAIDDELKDDNPENHKSENLVKKGDKNIWTEELPAKHIYVLPLNNKIKKRVLKNI